MPLPPSPSDSSYLDEIAEMVRGEYDSEIEVIVPGKTGTFNPRTDGYTGGTPDSVKLGRRAARVQHLSINERADGRDWGTKRRYRVQTDPQAGDPIVNDTMVARVVSCAHDPSLAGALLQVLSSSIAGVLTIETVTERGVTGNG